MSNGEVYCFSQFLLDSIELEIGKDSLDVIRSSPINVRIYRDVVEVVAPYLMGQMMYGYIDLFGFEEKSSQNISHSEFVITIRHVVSNSQILGILRSVIAYILSIKKFIPYGSEGNSYSYGRLVNNYVFHSILRSFIVNKTASFFRVESIDLSEYDKYANVFNFNITVTVLIGSDIRFKGSIERKLREFSNENGYDFRKIIDHDVEVLTINYKELSLNPLSKIRSYIKLIK